MGIRLIMALLTVRAAAGQLGVAYSTLKRWMRDGRVRTTRTEGGHHRVSQAEIERLLARQEPARSTQARSTQAARSSQGARDPLDESLGGLSARNRLHGFVDEVRIDGLLAQVRLNVGGQPLTAVITADAVRALNLRRGDDALAIVKSTEVMIARASTTGASTTGARTAAAPRTRSNRPAAVRRRKR